MLLYAVLSTAMLLHAQTRRKTVFTFPLQIMVPATDGQEKPVEIDVSKDGGQEEASCYRKGSRVEIDGTMYLKHRGDRTYFNLFANEIRDVAADAANTLKGEMVFCGKVGKNIEEKKDKKDQSYTMFSAFSTEKVADGFEYQWVRFFCFNRQREEWLQPGVKIDAKGEMGLTVHNGKPNVSCRVEELTMCRRFV